MSRPLVGAILVALGFYAYTEFSGPGGKMPCSSGGSGGGFSAYSGSSKPITGAAAGLAGKIGN